MTYAALRDPADLPADEAGTDATVPLAEVAERRRNGAGTSRRAALLWLLLITVAGGALRFADLGKPVIWGDEAMTYSRTFGAYGDLLDALRTDGFPPYHYSLTWWLGAGCPVPWPTGEVFWAGVWSPGGEAAWYDAHAPLPAVAPWVLFPDSLKLTPFVLRLVPAICGTLMVPAVYFLAVQLARRKVALVAALFACCSAFLLNYSRDAKMYQQAWLFVTLNLGCLLWWLRLRRERRYSRPAWWLWVASGIATVGFNTPSGVIFACEAVALLTFSPRRAVGWGAWGDWLSLPFALVALLPTPMSVAWAATAVAFALDGEWSTVAALLAAWPLAGLLVALLLRRPGDERPRVAAHLSRHLQRLWVPDLVPFALGLLVVGVGLAGYYGFDGRKSSLVPDAVVVDGFNRWAPLADEGEDRRRRRRGEGSGIEWVRWYNDGRDLESHVGYTLSAFLTAWEWPRERDWDQIEPDARWWLSRATLVLAALLALGAASRPRRDREGLRHGVTGARRAAWLGVMIVVPMWVWWLLSRDEKAIDAVAATLPADADFSAWAAWLWGSVATLIDELPLVWWLVLAPLAAGAVAGVSRSTSPRGRAVLAWRAVWPALLVGALMLVAWWAVSVFGKPLESSIWMPRYLGFVWPAVAVATAALLMRLPTRPLRVAAVALLVGVNLAQHAARVYAGSEPPSDRIALDLLEARRDKATKLFLRADPPNNNDGGPGGMGAPGGGYPFSFPVAYYAALSDPDTTWRVSDFRRFRANATYAGPFNSLSGLSGPLFVSQVARRSNADQKATRLVLWTSSGPSEDVADEPFLPALGEGWRRVSSDVYPVRDHWTWERFALLRRRVYERDAAAQNP